MYSFPGGCGSSYNHDDGLFGLACMAECEPLEQQWQCSVQTGEEETSTESNPNPTTIACGSLLVWDVKCPCNGRTGSTWPTGGAISAHELYG